MSSPAEVVAKYFKDVGLSDASWPVSVGAVPATAKDNYLTVFDAGAEQDGRIQKTGERIQHPLIQIRIQAVNYPTGWAKGVAIQAALDALHNRPVTINTTTYTIKAATVYMPLVKIGQAEQNARELFTINVRLTL